MRCVNFFNVRMFLFAFFLSGVVADISGNSELSVDVGKAKTIVNKEIFGGLMERLGRGINGGVFVGTNSSVANVNGLRKDIIEGLKECGFGALQWPGGCAAQGYNWNPPNPSNDMGTDRFMQLCELTDCTPVITGRSNDRYAPSNKAWVRYINNNPDHPEWNLKYFQIGNEVWGCGGDYGSWSAYKPHYNRNYDSLSVPVNDKKLQLIAGTDGIWRFEQWLKDMLADDVDRIDLIEIHDYIYYPDDIPCLNFSEAQYYEILDNANEGQMRPRLDAILSILDQFDPENRIKIWEGEWGNWLIDNGDGWQQNGTLMDALSAGETLNLFVQYAHRMMGAGVAQVINVIHSIMNTKSASGAMVKTPTFYVFKMYIPHHIDSARSAPVTLESERVNSIPAVSAAATVNDKGYVNVSLTNIDLSQSRTVEITLSNTEQAYACSLAQVITGPAMNSYNHYSQAEEVSIEELAASNYDNTGDRTFSVTLPAKSIVMVSLRPVSPVRVSEPLQLSPEKNMMNVFTIDSGSRDGVRISSSLDRKMAVTIGLYRMDGRCLVNNVSATFGPGAGSITLKKDLFGKGVNILKINGPNSAVTKQIIVAK